MKLLGRAITTVTATVQKLSLDVFQPHTLINSGANLVAYRHSDSADEALAGASETALRAVGGGILHPGERVTLPAGFAWVEVACATGATSTLRVEPGAVTPGVQLVADLDIGDVNILNAEGTKISPATEAKQDVALAAIRSIVRKASAEIITTTDTAVTAIPADATNNLHFVRVTNDGTVAGFYSIDGGATWDYLPARAVIEEFGILIQNKAIQVKRIAGGSNLSDVYVSAR